PTSATSGSTSCPIGAIPLQKLTPMDLNALYRSLLDQGRRFASPPVRQHAPEVVARVKALRAKGRTWQSVADTISEEFPEEHAITRHAVAALHRRRSEPRARKKPAPGLKPRTVR